MSVLIESLVVLLCPPCQIPIWCQIPMWLSHILSVSLYVVGSYSKESLCQIPMWLSRILSVSSESVTVSESHVVESYFECVF